jgi:hypothetical protein
MLTEGMNLDKSVGYVFWAACAGGKVFICLTMGGYVAGWDPEEVRETRLSSCREVKKARHPYRTASHTVEQVGL